MLPVAIIKLQQKASLQMAAIAAALFFIIQLGLSIYCPTFSNHRVYSCLVLSLVGLVSGCAGWAAGIVLSPLGSQVNGIQKIIAGLSLFWSGVVVSHLQDVIPWFNARQNAPMRTATKIELTFGLGLFLLGLCVTFNTRFDDYSTEPPPPTIGTTNE
jgi:hypothetical protein